MIQKVKDYINKYHLLTEGDSVIVGVSGGADSVCLLTLLKELSTEYSFTLTAVHVNHGIRGTEAQGDYIFVQELCNKHQIDFIGFNIDVPDYAKKKKLSIEEAGRVCRYDLFHKVAEERKANKIAVAHNKNDSAETILWSLFRGSGIKGLTGIKPVLGNIVRPLLCVERREIEEFLHHHQILYRNDSTNSDTVYTRNKIRLQLMPEITESINYQAITNIVNAGQQLNEIEEYLKKITDKYYLEMVCETKSGIELNCMAFSELDVVLQKRIVRKIIYELNGKLKDITSIHIQDTLELINKKVGRFITLPYEIRVRRAYDTIVFEHEFEQSEGICLKSIEVQPENEYFLEGCGKIILKTYTVHPDEKCRKNLEENRYTKCFDYDKIKGDLFFRSRLEGDYITIDTSGHKKKLKSYFIDQKIPKEERDKIPLLASGNHVVWIVGYRVSETFKVTNNTKRVLKVLLDGGHNAK